MYVAFPSGSTLDRLEVAELLDTALRIFLHKLDIKFYLRVQSTAPLEDSVSHYLKVAEIDPDPFEQAKHGSVWGARCMRDDYVTQIACAVESVSYQRLATAMDSQLEHTSTMHLGFTLDLDDTRTAAALAAYFPVPPGGPVPFWIGVAWGMARYAKTYKLALEARRNGVDILEQWADFQLSAR